METLGAHASAISQLITQLARATDLTESHFGRLGNGFEKFHKALDYAEERVLSWNTDNRLWIFSGFVGFMVGSASGWTKWTTISISSSRRVDQSDYRAVGILPNSRGGVRYSSCPPCFNGRSHRVRPCNLSILSQSTKSY